jgi:hypothetical protein
MASALNFQTMFGALGLIIISLFRLLDIIWSKVSTNSFIWLNFQMDIKPLIKRSGNSTRQ